MGRGNKTVALKNIGDLFSDLQISSKAHSFVTPYQNNFFDFLRLVNNWSKVVGQKLSQETSPLKIQGKKLFIMTSHSLYAQELQYLESEIIKKIGTFFPSSRSQIKNLCFQATEHFNVIKSEQMDKAKKRKNGPKDIEDSNFHHFNPEYIKAKERVKGNLSPIDDCELFALLEEVNIRHYQDQGKKS